MALNVIARAVSRFRGTFAQNGTALLTHPSPLIGCPLGAGLRERVKAGMHDQAVTAAHLVGLTADIPLSFILSHKGREDTKPCCLPRARASTKLLG